MSADANKQRLLQDFVNREVVHCFSQAIFELQKSAKEDSDLYQQIIELSSKVDYYSALEAEGWSYKKGVLVNLSDSLYWDGSSILDIEEEEALEVSYDESDVEEERSLCGELGIDPEQEEVYEHWIVTEWLGKKLQAYGELVDFDFLGLVIWGRTTTGQSICMDSVIERIYDEFIDS